MVTRFEIGQSVGQRGRQRLHSQRGAAVFIVVMVLTLLTAVGVFAVRSASLADVAAGYDREAAQTSLIAEYATTATAAYLATSAANAIVANIQPSTYCQSNMGVKAPCFKMTSGLIQASTQSQSGETLFETTSSSLNANGATTADFVVELTDPARSGHLTAGDSHSPVQVTVTSIAQVQQAGACVNGVGKTWNAGQQVMRAVISAGNQ
jgi:hypothetical protein